MLCEIAKLQVADCEADDGCFVELTGDGGGKWKHFCELIKFIIFLSPSGPGSVTRFLLAQLQNTAKIN